MKLSPETRDALRARLARHLFGKAKTLTPNAEIAARLAQDSGGAGTSGGASDQDAGSPGPENPAFLDSGSPQARGQELRDAGNPVPEKPALLPAVVAWDLTLRCPVCNSGVEGNVREYHCRNQRCSIGAAQAEAFVASRRGPTSQEMVEAERSFENGLIRYTSRGAVRQGGGR